MEIQCKICSKVFKARPSEIKRGRKYCSHRCYWTSLKESLKGENNPHYKEKIIKKCLFCGKTFEVYPNTFDRKQIFCSRDCERKHSGIPDRLCLTCGKLFHPRKCKGRFCSIGCYRLYRLKHPVRYWLDKKRENLSKEKNPAWKGGVTKNSKLLRSTTEFKEWRKKVFERDNYACQICFQRSRFLEPHHIKSLAIHPKLAFDINNGVTLCINCHKKVDKWRH